MGYDNISLSALTQEFNQGHQDLVNDIINDRNDISSSVEGKASTDEQYDQPIDSMVQDFKLGDKYVKNV